jgi:hypothetical protein
MVLRWFDTTEVAAFAKSLVDDYCRSRSGAAARGDKSQRLDSRLQRLADRANDFQRSLGINVYKKAKLIKLVREGLSARDIGDDEANLFVNALLFGPLRKPA